MAREDRAHNKGASASASNEKDTNSKENNDSGDSLGDNGEFYFLVLTLLDTLADLFVLVDLFVLIWFSTYYHLGNTTNNPGNYKSGRRQVGK